MPLEMPKLDISTQQATRGHLAMTGSLNV